MPFSGAGRSADSDPQAGGFSSMDAKNASQQLILAKSSAAPAAGLFALSYADGGPTRTAVLRGRRSYADSARGTCPSGLPSIACGRDGEGVFACAASFYLKEGDGGSDSDKFFE